MAQPRHRMSVSIQDVARVAGVSTALVSRVLSGRLGNVRVSPATQEKVRQAADRLGYTPRRWAQNLARQRSRTIALLSPSPWPEVRGRDALGNHYLHQILQGIESQCATSGYNALYTHWSMPPEADGDARQPWPRVMLDRSVDGVVLADYTCASVVRHLAKLGVRCVQVGSNIDDPDCRVHRYYGDLEEAMRQVVARLHAMGHRRVALFVPCGPGPGLIERAFLGCAREHAGLSLRAVPVGPTAVDDGLTSLHELLAGGFDPQAMICPHVMMAMRFAQDLADQGRLCPRDYSLVAWSMAGWPAMHLPGSGSELATVELPNYEVASHAARDLIDALEQPDSSESIDAGRAFDHPWPCDVHWGRSVISREP